MVSASRPGGNVYHRGILPILPIPRRAMVALPFADRRAPAALPAAAAQQISTTTAVVLSCPASSTAASTSRCAGLASGPPAADARRSSARCWS